MIRRSSRIRRSWTSQRANDMSLTFAPGLHHCIGHMLAKVQLSEFFAELAQRFEPLEIVEGEFAPNLVFRGVYGFKVPFSPTCRLSQGRSSRYSAAVELLRSTRIRRLLRACTASTSGVYTS